MKNKTAGYLALLISLGMIAGSPSFAGTPSFSNRLLNTSHNNVLAVASVAPSKPAASTRNGLKPNWAWSKTQEVWGYAQIKFPAGGWGTYTLNCVEIESITKGFSYKAYWSAPSFPANFNLKIKWSILNVPVDKTYRVTAYGTGNRTWSKTFYASKPTYFENYQVQPDFVLDFTK